MTYAWGASRQTLGLGPHTFPPEPTSGPRGLREGGVTVTVETSQNLDQQKATGTDKARTKRTGKNGAKVSITLWWTFRIDDLVRPMIQTWDPNGPDNGGPFRVLHPNTDLRRVSDVIIEKMGGIEELYGGMQYRVKLDGEEWVPPPKPKQGTGTKTPTKSTDWYQVPRGGEAFTSPTAGGNTSNPQGQGALGLAAEAVNAVEEFASGFLGSNGPDAEP